MGLHIGMSVKNLMSMRKQLPHEYKFNPFLICAFALQLNPTYISSLHLFTDKVVKDKWNNLIDYFNTLKKTYKETNPEPRSGAGAPEPVSKPTWKYWDHMQFMFKLDKEPMTEIVSSMDPVQVYSLVFLQSRSVTPSQFNILMTVAITRDTGVLAWLSVV